MNTRPTPETLAIWTEYLAGMRTDEAAIDGFKLIERERDEARIELEKYTTDSEDDALYNVRRLRKELTAVTAQRDRLAAVLQRIRDGYGGQVASPNCCEDCDHLLPIDEALQSLTPNAER
jgi:hypothetical protein